MTETNGARASGQRECLLVVEDDPAIADLLTAIVEDLGCSVLRASDGLSALQLAREVRPCLITLDLGLPALDGRTVLRALKAHPATAGIAVLVISAFTETLPPDERRSALAVLHKPFDVPEVVRIIERVLHAARSTEEGYRESRAD